MKRENCFLLIEDGSVFRGKSFGAPAPMVDELEVLVAERAAGEVVFNTGMCGYYEILTDPSYTGQVVTMTYPLIGNYGCDINWSETLESSRRQNYEIKAAGLVIRSLYEGPVPEGRITLDEYLKANHTPGITEVDTRALTLKIRQEGMPRGVILKGSHGGGLSDQEISQGVSFLKSFPEMTGRNLAVGQAVKSSETHNAKGALKIALLDCGIKDNIRQILVDNDCEVLIVPPTMTAEEILSHEIDGVMVSNGPGDPATLGTIVETIKDLIGKKPLYGICLGHQLISQALGAKTGKMKFGHHGVNNPVRDERSGKVFVTSQNHGFEVLESSLPKWVEVWFRNANDNTIEGIRSDEKRLLTAQFHPEAAPGPEDTQWIFQEFISQIKSTLGSGDVLPSIENSKENA